MNGYFDWLGFEVRDRVTGFAGVADSICFDLYGCVQVSICPKHDAAEKERKHSYWFDVKRLEKTGAKRIMEAPKFSTPGSEIGHADKAPFGR
jgi:hypothetical protein